MTGAAEPGTVTVYWRPGCPYRARLFADLERLGLPTHRVNIWADPDAAARVRSITGGNETVPTVTIGTAAMVNPRIRPVLEAVYEHAPQLLAELDQTRLARARRRPWWRAWASSLR